MTIQAKRRAVWWDMSVLQARVLRVIVYTFLIAWAVINFAPFVWVSLAGLKTDVEIFENPFGLPEQWLFRNYRDAYELAHIGQYMGNSLIFAGGAAVVGLTMATLCAFPFARFNFRFKGVLWGFLMLMLFLPQSMRIIPLIVFLYKIELYGTMPAITLTYATSQIPFSAFFLRAFMESIPRELEEAAVMDGANMWQVFSHIIVRLSAPALATLGIFSFITAWNELFFMLLMSRDQSTYTIPAGIATLSSATVTHHSLIASAFTMSFLPVLIVFILGQRQVVRGMTAGAVQGV